MKSPSELFALPLVLLSEEELQINGRRVIEDANGELIERLSDEQMECIVSILNSFSTEAPR